MGVTFKAFGKAFGTVCTTLGTTIFAFGFLVIGEGGAHPGQDRGTSTQSSQHFTTIHRKLLENSQPIPGFGTPETRFSNRIGLPFPADPAAKKGYRSWFLKGPEHSVQEPFLTLEASASIIPP